MRRSFKAAACLCAAVLSLSALSAVSFADETAAEKPAVTAEAEKKAPKARNVKYGKVTAVNGSDITVALGEYAAKQTDTDKTEKADKTDDTAAKKEKPASKPEKKTSDSTTTEAADNTSDKTTDSTGKKASGKHGKKRGRKGEFTENGSTLTVTITDGITLKKSGKAVTTADIAVGDILTLEYNDSDELVGVKVKGEKSEKSDKTGKSGKSGSESGTKQKGSRKGKKTSDTDQTVTA